ncbi:hypothetical protein BH09VER1_BH09VER1_45830 [soil metagenome]
MAISQASLSSTAEAALRAFAALLPGTIPSLAVSPRDEGLEITLANPAVPARSIIVCTDRAELTVLFAASHIHIADYGRGFTEAQLVEDMIYRVFSIICGHSRSYEVRAGGTSLGGGFVDGAFDAKMNWAGWKRADKFEVFSWDGLRDETVLPTD